MKKKPRKLDVTGPCVWFLCTTVDEQAAFERANLNAGTRHADAFAGSVKHSGRLNELTLMPLSTGLFNIVGQLKTLPSAFNMARAGKLPPLIHKAIPGVERIRKIFERVGGRFK